MSIPFLWFLFCVLPNLSNLVSVMAPLAGFCIFVCTVILIPAKLAGGSDGDSILDVIQLGYKFLIPTFIVSILLGVVTPNKDQLYMMAGGYAVTNSQEIMKLPDNIAKAANVYVGILTQHLEEGTKSVEPEVIKNENK